MILSVFAWAIYTVISKSIKGNDPLVITALSTFFGTAFLIPTLAVELWDQQIPSITPKACAAIIYLGVFASALSFLLYDKALKTLSAAQVGNFMNLDPGYWRCHCRIIFERHNNRIANYRWNTRSGRCLAKLETFQKHGKKVLDKHLKLSNLSLSP